jgi:hypothetical protein
MDRDDHGLAGRRQRAALGADAPLTDRARVMAEKPWLG